MWPILIGSRSSVRLPPFIPQASFPDYLGRNNPAARIFKGTAGDSPLQFGAPQSGQIGWGGWGEGFDFLEGGFNAKVVTSFILITDWNIQSLP